MNPKLLEDKLWQKDVSSKDFFKFEQCHTVHIGNFITSPVDSGDICICSHGVRMTVNDPGEFKINLIIHFYYYKTINCFFFINLRFNIYIYILC